MTFRFNKSNSQLASTIEMATDGHSKEAEDWSVFMNICDLVNSAEEGPKEAVKCIKKRFHSKHSPTISLSLSLLETLVKNCGRRLHSQVCTRELMADLLKIISPKNNHPISLQNTVLSLIQNWALSFKHQPELKEVARTYQELKNKGVEFPAVNQDEISQYLLSAQNPRPPQQPLQQPHQLPLQQPQQLPPQQPLPHQLPPQQLPLQQQPPQSSSHSSIPQHKMEKLRADLAVVKGHAETYGGLLTLVSEGKRGEGDMLLLQELDTSCRDMQKRILALIQKVEVEALTGELLQWNDELNNQFVRYDRFMRQQQHNNTLDNTDNNNTVGSINILDEKNNNKPDYVLHTAASTTTAALTVDNLIDFGDISDIYNPNNNNNNNNNKNNNNTNNNNTNNNKKNEAAGLSEEMVNLEVDSKVNPLSPLKTKTRSAQAQSQMSNESDYKEMESWLEENETHTQRASTMEFEKFLDERAKASQQLPEDKNKNNNG